jgi:hypothetical protein
MGYNNLDPHLQNFPYGDHHMPPTLKSTEGNIFGMYVVKSNFAIFANRYYSQLLFSCGGRGKLLPQPTTTNNKHQTLMEMFAPPVAWF